MKILEILGALGVLLGGTLVATVEYVAESIRTDVASLDRAPIRLRVAFYALRHFGADAISDMRIPRALMSIVHNESLGLPSNYLGDTGTPRGPSVGPMQVLRETAEGLGLWHRPAGISDDDARTLYADEADREGQGIDWGVQVFKAKLDEAQGNVADAVRRYNGNGPDAMAYLDRALTFARSKAWELSA